MKKSLFVTLAVSAVALSACKNAQDHRHDVTCSPSTFSLGKVQSTIHKGMPQSDVVQHLGSPNIVTNDEHGRDTWVYDKVSSEAAQSSSSYGGTIILFGGQQRSGAYESSQKSLTVTIKFDTQKRVESINYHQSKF